MKYSEFIDKYGINITIQNIVVETSLSNSRIIKDKYDLLDNNVNVFISFIDSNNNYQYKKVSISIFDLDKLFNREAIKNIFKSIEMKNRDSAKNNDIFMEAFEIIENKLNFLDKILKEGIKNIDDLDKISIILSNRSKSSNIEKNSSTIVLKFNSLNRFILLDDTYIYSKLKSFINEEIDNENYSVNDYKEYLKNEFNIESSYFIEYFSFETVLDNIFILEDKNRYIINNSNMEKLLNIIMKNVNSNNYENIKKIYNDYIIKSNFLQILNSAKIENEKDMKLFLKRYDVDIENLNTTKIINSLIKFFEIVGNSETMYKNINLYKFLTKLSNNFIYFKKFEKLNRKFELNQCSNSDIISI